MNFDSSTKKFFLGTLGYSDFMDRAMGFMTPWATVPHSILDYSDDMNFFQRSWNVILSLTDSIVRDWYYMPAQEKLAQKYFRNMTR